MNMTKTIGTIFAIGVVASSAWGNNGVQNYSDEIEVGFPGFYIECLDENVTWTWHITGTFHEFVTPSGTYHLLDNWRAWGEFRGLTTGRTWVGKLKSPFQWNAGPGQTNQWVAKAIMKPLTGDGPMFVFENQFKITVNANGDLVVYRPEDDPEDFFRCLGKK